MNILDSIIGNTAKMKVEMQIVAARREGFDAGYETGREAMKEQLRETGRLGANEDTHKFNCPSCNKTVHYPCLNYVFANKEN